MITLEQHKEAAKDRQAAEVWEKRHKAFQILRLAIGSDLTAQSEDWGPGDDEGLAWIKFKNHHTIHVEEIVFQDKRRKYYYKVTGVAIGCFTNFGLALIAAEIPNTWWNRLKGKYKR